MTRAIGLLAGTCTVLAAVLASFDAPHGLAVQPGGQASVSSGYFVSDDDTEIEWTVHSPGLLRVAVDGTFVFNRDDASQAPAVFPLTPGRGSHIIEIAHGLHVTPVVSWRTEFAHVSTSVEPSAFSPVPLSQTRWRLRAARPWVGLAAGAGWTLWLMLLAWRGLTRPLPGPPVPMDRPMLLLLVAAAVAVLAGISWGWPVRPWAPDELWPSQVLDGLAQRFSGGWFDLYPPGHFYLLSLLYSPFLLLSAAGWLPVEDSVRHTALHLVSRLVSTGMALGVIMLVARLAVRLGGRDYAWPAALCASASLPFVYYARLANLEMPYLFWFCLSLLWFHASLTTPSVRRVIGFAAMGMAAIVTKDQAYALYVLPALWLAWRLVSVHGGIRMLVAGAATAAGVFVLGYNLLFNAGGFAQHLASITGGGSQGYEMVAPGAVGLIRLAGIVASQLWWMLGVPGLVLCIAGFWFHRTNPWIPGWIWLFPCSYLLLFVAVVGYSYDRFLLPVSLVLGLLGGAGLRGLLTAERSRLPRVVAAVCVVWLLWRVASVDVLQLRDSRYSVERWLHANVPQGAVVAEVRQAGYLPSLDGLQRLQIEATPAATLQAAPAFLVVNSEYMNRFADDAPMRRWWRWVQSSEAPYKEIYRFKRDLRWTELAWWSTFNDRVEAVFTNLDKANPEIVVFARTDGPGSR